MGIFTHIRTLTARIVFIVLLSCLLAPIYAENKAQEVTPADSILHEVDSINRMVHMLNSMERRWEYEAYKHQADSLWMDVANMNLEEKVQNYRALMATLIFLDSSQPPSSFRHHISKLEELVAHLPQSYLVLRLRANMIMSHVYLLTHKQYKAYPLLEDVVSCVLSNSQVDSLTQLSTKTPHLNMIYGVLLHQLLCYQVVKESIVERNKAFLDSPIGEHSRSIAKNCSTSDKTKAIAYGMVDGHYQEVIEVVDALLSNKRLSRDDILYLLKIQLDAINRLPKSRQLTRLLHRAIVIQDSVLAHKEDVYNIDYNTYNQLNNQQKILSDLRREKESIWTQHMVIGCVIAILAATVVLYLLYSYRKRSKINLEFLNDLKKSAEMRRRALTKTEQACEQQLNLMRNFNHDLRVPMNALVGFSNILGSPEEISDQEQKEAGKIVHETSRQLIDMVNNILDIARASSDHIVVENHTFPIKDLLDQSQWRAFTEDMSNVHKIQLIAYEEDTTIYNDNKYIVRVLELLVKNAIVTSESGDITLCAHVDDKQDQLLIDVLSPYSHQEREVIDSCLDRTMHIADYVDANEYFLVLARMFCDLLNCDLLIHESSEAGVNMQVVIPLTSASHEE